MAASLVDADEYRVRVDEVELHIPAIAAKDVDINTGDRVMRRTLVMLPAAPLDDLHEIVGRDLPHLEQVLRLNLAARLVKERAFPQRFDQASLCLRESNSSHQYTKILVKIKFPEWSEREA
ncbi:hypothetical protein ACR03S_19760 (plasmid) [Limimaricola variabilis]